MNSHLTSLRRLNRKEECIVIDQLFCFIYIHKNLKTWIKHQHEKDRTEQHVSAQTSVRHTVISPEV